jgi:hypothetical protein
VAVGEGRTMTTAIVALVAVLMLAEAVHHRTAA